MVTRVRFAVAFLLTLCLTGCTPPVSPLDTSDNSDPNNTPPTIFSITPSFPTSIPTANLNPVSTPTVATTEVTVVTPPLPPVPKPQLVSPPTAIPETTLTLSIQSKYVHSHYCPNTYSPAPVDQFPPDETKLIAHIQNSLGNVHFAFVGVDLADKPVTASRVELQLYRLEQHCSLPFISSGPGFTIRYMTTPWQWEELRPVCDHELPSVEFFSQILLPPPPPDNWFTFDITSLYNAWQSGVCPNYGLRLEHLSTYDNTWTIFASEHHPDSTKHPRLVITTGGPLPPFKFPLAGGYNAEQIKHDGLYDFGVIWHGGYCTHENNPLLHNGLDLPAAIGDPVCAAQDGVVRNARLSADYGGCVVVETGETFTCTYMHVRPNDGIVAGTVVRRGQPIATVITYAGNPVSHLHFGLRYAPYDSSGLALRGRLPSASCETEALGWEPAFPERFVDPLALNWEE